MLTYYHKESFLINRRGAKLAEDESFSYCRLAIGSGRRFLPQIRPPLVCFQSPLPPPLGQSSKKIYNRRCDSNDDENQYTSYRNFGETSA